MARDYPRLTPETITNIEKQISEIMNYKPTEEELKEKDDLLKEFADAFEGAVGVFNAEVFRREREARAISPEVWEAERNECIEKHIQAEGGKTGNDFEVLSDIWGGLTDKLLDLMYIKEKKATGISREEWDAKLKERKRNLFFEYREKNLGGNLRLIHPLDTTFKDYLGQRLNPEQEGIVANHINMCEYCQHVLAVYILTEERRKS